MSSAAGSDADDCTSPTPSQNYVPISPPSSSPSPPARAQPYRPPVATSVSTNAVNGNTTSLPTKPYPLPTRYILFTPSPSSPGGVPVPLLTAEQIPSPSTLAGYAGIQILTPKDQQIEFIQPLPGGESILKVKAGCDEWVPWGGKYAVAPSGGTTVKYEAKMRKMGESWWRAPTDPTSSTAATPKPQLPTPETSPTIPTSTTTTNPTIPTQPRAHPSTQDFPARAAYLKSQGLFRVEPCNTYKLKGHCKWGDKCTYSHDPVEREVYLAKFGINTAVGGQTGGLAHGHAVGKEEEGGLIPHQIIPAKVSASASVAGPALPEVGIIGTGIPRGALVESSSAAAPHPASRRFGTIWREPANPPATLDWSRPKAEPLSETAIRSHPLTKLTLSEENLYRLYHSDNSASASASGSKSNSTHSSSPVTASTTLSTPIIPLRAPTGPSNPNATKLKGQKTHCTYFLRYGECDFMQQGCKFSHSAPEEAITATVGDKAVVVVPGKDMPRRLAPVAKRAVASGAAVVGAARRKREGSSGGSLISFLD